MFSLWNNLVCTLLGQLSVADRLDAMRRLNTGNYSDFLKNKWVVMLGWSAICCLLILLLAVRKSNQEKEKQSIQHRFNDQASQLGLSNEERSIVEAVCRCSGVKHKDTIFTSRKTFEKGLGYLMQEVFSAGQVRSEREKLHSLIFSIKSKLGFANDNPEKGLSNCVGKEKTSRQIPTGTVLTISLLGDQSDLWTQAEVMQNGTFEILLQPEHPISCKAGDLLKIRYSNAAVMWEFNAIALEYSEDRLALNHSEQIRYVNRRRFERIEMQRPGKIASFPVFEEPQSGSDMEIRFSPAVITEIAGTGLRVKTDLPLSIHQRVLMMVELSSDRIIQDVAEVRDIREESGDYSVIVELIGLNTSALNELMCMVNRINSEAMITSRADTQKASEESV